MFRLARHGFDLGQSRRPPFP